MLIVALCAYDVYSAAVPENGEARPAPVAPAGAHGKKKTGRQQQNKSMARNETVEGGARRNQRTGQKKGVQTQAAKGKQQLKVKKGKINSNKKPGVASTNREQLNNKRNKNQYNKTPVDKLDRNLFTKTAAGDDEYVDYGAPQAPPAPGNRLVKTPNFAAHQKPSDSSVSSGGNKPLIGSSQGNVRMVKPMPFLPPNFAQKADIGVSEPGSSLDGAMVMRHARPMPQDGINPELPQKAILPYVQPMRSDDNMPDDGKAEIMQGHMGIVPEGASVADKVNLSPTIDSQPEYLARPAMMPEMTLQESP